MCTLLQALAPLFFLKLTRESQFSAVCCITANENHVVCSQLKERHGRFCVVDEREREKSVATDSDASTKT